MNHGEIAFLAIGIGIKHFIADLPLQTRYQHSNKGIWMHPGGLLHAGIHALGSLLVVSVATCIFPLAFSICFCLCIADGCVHYLIDWSKKQFNCKMGWTKNTIQYYRMKYVDQCLHASSYIVIIWTMVHFS